MNAYSGDVEIYLNHDTDYCTDVTAVVNLGGQVYRVNRAYASRHCSNELLRHYPFGRRLTVAEAIGHTIWDLGKYIAHYERRKRDLAEAIDRCWRD